MKNLFLLLLATSILFLTSCSSVRAYKDILIGKKNTVEDNHWRARGKFSYRSDETSESGNFDWRQQGENYQLRLFGPLGLGSVKISGNPNLVRIRTGDQDISSDQPLSLLHRITGFEIPLNSMPMWLTGDTASLSPSEITLNDEGQIQSFAEREWLLNYSNFKEFDNQQIPTTINASKDGINLRMLVYTWKAELE